MGVKRVFTKEEVDRVIHAADRDHRLLDSALLHLLFTTGIRIGAAAGMIWQHLLRDDGEGIREMAMVREKGNQVRVLLLTKSTRDRLWRLFQIRD